MQLNKRKNMETSKQFQISRQGAPRENFMKKYPQQ